jgi:hypothetical protein
MIVAARRAEVQDAVTAALPAVDVRLLRLTGQGEAVEHRLAAKED